MIRCPTCHGQGGRNGIECPQCSGEGYVVNPRTYIETSCSMGFHHWAPRGPGASIMDTVCTGEQFYACRHCGQDYDHPETLGGSLRFNRWHRISCFFGRHRKEWAWQDGQGVWTWHPVKNRVNPATQWRCACCDKGGLPSGENPFTCHIERPHPSDIQLWRPGSNSGGGLGEINLILNQTRQPMHEAINNALGSFAAPLVLDAEIMNSREGSRRGVLSISREFFRSSDVRGLSMIFANFFPVGVRNIIERDVYLYTGYSPLFDRVPPGERSPMYQAIVHHVHDSYSFEFVRIREEERQEYTYYFDRINDEAMAGQELPP